MNKKVLIDTNILLDAAMSERPEWAWAVMLLDEIAYGRLDGCIASTSLKDAYYVMSKYADEPTARSFVSACLDAFEVLEVSASLCRVAVQSNEPDFEDGIIRACAESAGVDFIISRDEAAFRKTAIKRLSARDYAELFCEITESEL
jgi:predicted nucleic acid-binding protein